MVHAASKSQEVRSKLGHPVVDADGHLQELVPVLKDYVLDYLREIGGASMVEQFERVGLTYRTSVADRWMGMTWEERYRTWTSVPAWWGQPSKNTLDRAAATFPNLLAERMDELGIDFAVMYPSHASNLPDIVDPDLRRAAVRAYNSFYADLYRPYADRLTPAALMPMDTPEEAIDELDYVVGELGLKAIMIRPTKRPIADIAARDPDLARRSPTASTCTASTARTTTTRYGGAALSSGPPSLRTPAPRDGGAAAPCPGLCTTTSAPSPRGRRRCASRCSWAGSPSASPGSTSASWKAGRRGPARSTPTSSATGRSATRSTFSNTSTPPSATTPASAETLEIYGDERVKSEADRIEAFFREPEPRPDELDDLAACGIEKPEDIRDLFVAQLLFRLRGRRPTHHVGLQRPR